jgi:hypothetical protein
VRTGEGPIGADGTLSIEIDTGPALRAHGDQDHRYTVEADVRDASRRTVSGSGAVLATRQALYAFVETDRGWYAPGGTVFASVRTLTAEGKPAAAAGKWRLARVLYEGANGAQIVENSLETHDAKTDEEGRLALSFIPQSSGLFRLTFETKDAWGGDVIGTTLVWVEGADQSSNDYRFNDLEILTDKRTYAPGETARILVRTAHPGATLLFADRTDLGTILSWRVIAMPTKTQVIELPITAADVPNRFVEALLVEGGRVHEEAREIFVPPPAAEIRVAVKPSKETYRPGEQGTVEVRATLPDGKPAVAAIALSVFDKAVLEIQPEMTPEIRAFFWGERRQHRAQHVTSLDARWQGAVSLITPEYPQGFWSVPGWYRGDAYGGWGYGQKLGDLPLGAGVVGGAVDDRTILALDGVAKDAESKVSADAPAAAAQPAGPRAVAGAAYKAAIGRRPRCARTSPTRPRGRRWS